MQAALRGVGRWAPREVPGAGRSCAGVFLGPPSEDRIEKYELKQAMAIERPTTAGMSKLGCITHPVL